MTLFILFLAAVFAVPFIIEARRMTMDGISREDAPGQFIDLTKGATHYRYIGDSEGPLAVCVHGLTTPSFVFEGLAKELVAKGYRVLVYDHYGRGFSDRPKGIQDREFFVSHLSELLDELGEDGRFDLYGYSMGGWVVTAFASIYPSRINRLILLAPGGMGHDLGLLAKLIRLPIFGEWLFYSQFAKQHREGCELERCLPSSVPFIVDRQQRELNYKGFLPSVLASLRGALSAQTQVEHEKIAKSQLDVTAIWGADDAVIPLAAKDKLAAWNPNVQNVVIDNAGHGIPYTHTDEVLGAVFPLGRFESKRSFTNG